MATAIERFEDFKERIYEMGLENCVKYTQQTENTDRYNIEILPSVLLANSTLVNHAVMGMIAHFENRKWTKDWSYTYIEKRRHSISFTNESD